VIALKPGAPLGARGAGHGPVSATAAGGRGPLPAAAAAGRAALLATACRPVSAAAGRSGPLLAGAGARYDVANEPRRQQWADVADGLGRPQRAHVADRFGRPQRASVPDIAADVPYVGHVGDGPNFPPATRIGHVTARGHSRSAAAL